MKKSRDPVQQLEELTNRAVELENMDMNVEAAEAFAVAADAAEQIGRTDEARMLRTYMRRNLVVRWAQKRWPDQRPIGRNEVIPQTSYAGIPHKKEIRLFRVSLRHRDIFVKIDRRGRIRVA